MTVKILDPATNVRARSLSKPYLSPIGQPFKRGQFLYVYTKDEDGKIHSKKDVGVFFIPMTGKMMKTAAPTTTAAASE